MRNRIQDAIESALQALGLETNGYTVEFTDDLSHGDLTSNVGLVGAKSAGLSPQELAGRILGHLEKEQIEGVENISIDGPGFLNFRLTNTHVVEMLTTILEKPENWGNTTVFENKTVMVEHTQPNPFKVFHIGHLMSNTIGESLSRIIDFSGAKVIRANYQGDVGPHVAKALWGVRQLGVDPSDVDALGKAYAHGAQSYENDTKAKEDIDEINRAIYERSDSDLNALYEMGRKASLERFEELYELLGSKFDRFYFESETAEEGKKIVEANPDVFPESDGARVFKGEEYGLHTRVFVTSKGFPTYEAKELGLGVLKQKEYPDCDLFVVTTAIEQKGVFEVVKKALEQIDARVAEKLVHITHGMLRLQSGKMSSRTGDVITGESLLSDMIEKSKERTKESRAEDGEQLARDIAVGAVKYQILKQAASKDIVFDEAKAFSVEGDSGPYVQYTYARARAVVEKAKAEGVGVSVGEEVADNGVAHMLERFPDVVARSAREYEPHHIAVYMSALASAFNTWYASEQILDGTDFAAQKVALAEAVAATLKNGLWLLGILAPERM